ncbi:hypothetical protein ABIB35_003728 [Arthrobacter sp. UYP6]
MDANQIILAQDHKTTEVILTDAGVPYVLLRNGYYFENWTDQISRLPVSRAQLFRKPVPHRAAQGRASTRNMSVSIKWLKPILVRTALNTRPQPSQRRAGSGSDILHRCMTA